MGKSKKSIALLVAALSLTACMANQKEVQTSVSETIEETELIEETEAIGNSDTREGGYDMETHTESSTEIPATETTTVMPTVENTEMLPTEIQKRRSGVEYPEFQKYTYYSQTAQRETPVNVLLPRDYSEEKEYPVLYILHGFFDNEDWMARDIVGISTMLTNLCDDGEAKEMIVVLPYIFCNKDMPSCTGMDLQNCFSYDNFINDLTTDLMPFIESSFSVAAGRENTAITGFSMGGRESLFIGFSHPELFGYIGAVCPAPGLVPIKNSPMHPGQMEKENMKFTNDTPYVFMISAAKNDGAVGDAPSTYHTILNENNVAHSWYIMDSTGHDHSSVTPHLYQYFKAIFDVSLT